MSDAARNRKINPSTVLNIATSLENEFLIMEMYMTIE